MPRSPVLLILPFLLALFLAGLPASAAVYQLGRKPVRLPDAPPGLERLANSPLRTAGESRLGRTEFSFVGDADAVKRLLVDYAAIGGGYVTVTAEFGMADARARLQVLDANHGGGHGLTVFVRTAEELAALRLPAEAVPVYAAASVGEPIDPAALAAHRELTAKVKAAVDAATARAAATRPATR